ncbi:MAG: ATP-binding cassette domain-containing protein, partial [Rickettsiales bacterium]|nr:ATP-binding cassette domain-containing protein [Rickettsiales bacterium]
AGAFGAITEVIGNLFKSLGAFERIYDILNDDDRNLATKTSKKISDPFPVKLVNVSFSYPNKTDQKTLDNINLTIEKHKITAIVGPSGAGKSSIFNILLKFFDISEGKISIGASNYSQLSKQDIRKHFSLVPQDPFMFSGSICENIALSQNYDEEKIIQALKAAQAYDFVEKLPQTIHTEIGENAAKISSGQKQRIAIARSVYHKSSIILLDEATSNIDNKNEKSFITSLESLKKDHAIVIISHKRETIENSDYVYVIDNGTIVEEGDETKLLNKKGLYKSLLGMQSS